MTWKKTQSCNFVGGKWQKKFQEANFGSHHSSFFVTRDQIEKGDVKMTHCPTDDMVGNFMTKGPQGMKLGKFGRTIMKIAGVLANPLVEDGPEMCTSCVACKGGTKVPCAEVP